MDTVALEAAFDQHKVAILGGVGAGVAVLALARKRKGSTAGKSSTGAATATDQQTAGGTSYYSTGGQLAGTNGAPYYDSSASDVYGAVQPQLESLGNQLTDLKNQLNTIPVPSAPAPTPAAAAPAPPPPAPAPAYVPPPPPPVPVPQAAAHAVDTWVTVARGDTLSGIAARFPQQDITYRSIAQQNGIANPNRIYAGQRIHIVG